jgi:hypothetical protein
MNTAAWIVFVLAIVIIASVAVLAVRRSSRPEYPGRTPGGDSPDGQNNP